MKKITKTKTVTDIIDVTKEMGDSLNDKYYETKDLKVANTSLSAYKTAISAAKTQLIYKKLTGNPGTIEFLEK